MTIAERNKKLKHFITCLKCEVSGKPCDDNCPTQYEAGHTGEIIENLEAISKALEQEPKTITEFADRCQECGAKYGKALEQTRWIPVSERLPEKNDVYLVAVNSWGCPTRDVDGFMAHTDRKWEVYGNKVIAWMPLPEPYRESEEV